MGGGVKAVSLLLLSTVIMNEIMDLEYFYPLNVASSLINFDLCFMHGKRNIFPIIMFSYKWNEQLLQSYGHNQTWKVP